MRTFLVLACTLLYVAGCAAAPARHLLQDASAPAEPDNATTPLAESVPAANATIAPAGNVSFPTLPEAVQAANTTSRDVVPSAANMSYLMTALEVANVTWTLNDTTNWTILAPNNSAFEAAAAALNTTTDELLGNQTLLTGILLYHVIPSGPVYTSNITNGTNLTTLAHEAVPELKPIVAIVDNTTEPATITFIGGAVGNNATVVVPNITAGGSVIHIINALLLPEEVNATANATAAAEPGTAAELPGAAAGTTVAGPTGANATLPAEANATLPAGAASPAPTETVATVPTEVNVTTPAEANATVPVELNTTAPAGAAP